MSDLEKFKKTYSDKAPRKRKNKIEHPPKFKPGYKYSEVTKSGEIVSEPQATNKINWKEQLYDYFGEEAENYSVVPGTAEIRYWDANMGAGEVQRFYYFKAKIVSNKNYMADSDFKLLLKEAKAKKPAVKIDKAVGQTFVVALSDWQIGKKGTTQTVERFSAAIPKIINEIKQLKKTKNIDRVLFAGLGDIVEGCSDFYAMQEFEVELDYRQQQKVARRMAYSLITQLMPLFKEGLVAFIGGNHGESRRNGKAFTSFGDNRDVQLSEELYEIFNESPAYKDKLKFIIPENKLSLTFDISGITLCLVHGHQMRGGSNAQAKAKKWLADQSLSRNAIADADILLMGHYHFFSAYETSSRLIVQAPTLDSGSQWFESTAGDASNPGILTMVIGGDDKWSNINVIR